MTDPGPGWTLRPPRLTWHADGTPESLDFGDLFAARADPVGEARHVVLDGLGAPALWDRPGAFTVAETGFGLGLNLLVCWDLWRQTAPPDARLHWVAAEGYPLDRAALVRALARVPALADLAGRLVRAWPPALPGLHVRALDARVTLILAFGDAREALPALLGGPADAWVLDGFAPARNPEMWGPAVLAQIARLSRPGTRLATYTAAGAVRRGLADAGFQVTRVPGFAGKREGLRAVFRGTDPDRVPAAPRTLRVAVVGAGIAGCAVAAALRRRGGGDVTILDARGHSGDSLPPHLLGLLEPRLEKGDSPAARLHAAAALHAVALYDSLAADPWRGPRGLLSADRGRRDDAWRRAVIDRMGWPPDRLTLLTADDAGRTVGVAPPGATALWHPRGGALSPPALLPALLGGTPVVTASVATLTPAEGSGWTLHDAGGRLLAEADSVVLATASETARLWPAAALPLRPTRGQVSVLRAAGPEASPRVAISSGAYATPPVPDGDGGWVRLLGATQVPWRPEDPDPFAPRDGDDPRIRANLASAWPALAKALEREPTVGALAGLRATTPDHLPLAGPLFEAAALADGLGDRLRRAGRAPEPIPAVPGLFTLCGLGSHGLTLAPLAAELLAAQITGTPWPVTAEAAAALNPARFACRALIQGRDPCSGSADAVWTGPT